MSRWGTTIVAIPVIGDANRRHPHGRASRGGSREPGRGGPSQILFRPALDASRLGNTGSHPRSSAFRCYSQQNYV